MILQLILAGAEVWDPQKVDSQSTGNGLGPGRGDGYGDGHGRGYDNGDGNGDSYGAKNTLAWRIP